MPVSLVVVVVLCLLVPRRSSGWRLSAVLQRAPEAGDAGVICCKQSVRQPLNLRPCGGSGGGRVCPLLRRSRLGAGQEGVLFVAGALEAGDGGLGSGRHPPNGLLLRLGAQPQHAAGATERVRVACADVGRRCACTFAPYLGHEALQLAFGDIPLRHRRRRLSSCFSQGFRLAREPRLQLLVGEAEALDLVDVGQGAATVCHPALLAASRASLLHLPAQRLLGGGGGVQGTLQAGLSDEEHCDFCVGSGCISHQVRITP